MAPRVKTSERIVQTSLELFNQQGERSVSTNHIAAHMEISPGNLYYHFPNKQAIIAVLFREYEALVDSFLAMLSGQRQATDAALGKLEVLAGVRQFPARVKCALADKHAQLARIKAEDDAVYGYIHFLMILIVGRHNY